MASPFLLMFNGIFSNTFTVRRFACGQSIDTVLNAAELQRIPDVESEVEAAVLHPNRVVTLTRQHFQALKDHHILIQ